MTVQPNSTSKKSDSGYTKLPRLSRTLKRRPVYRDFEEGDLKYLWVAYKKGLMDIKEDLSPKDFDEAMINIVDSEYEFGWTFMEGKTPVGFAFGSVAGPLVLLRDLTWLPNASNRNKIEHIVNLLNDMRKRMKIIFYSKENDKDYYAYIARHGIIRRVGHLHDMGETLSLWETRWQVR